MRHHEGDKRRAECREALPTVLESLGFSAEQGFELDTEGWVNVCFIGREHVVRFNARDPDLPKFEREEWAYRVLNDRGFPVPRLIARIDDKALTPYPALVTTRVRGENLEATWDNLDVAVQARLAAQAGGWLARLHAQPMRGFGEVFAPAHTGQRSLWTMLANERLTTCEPLFEEADIARFRHVFETALPLLESVAEPRLVHRDYHFGNLLHDGRDIVAVLDFEWSMASDPAIDRLRFHDIDDQCPGAAAPFEAGYRAEFGAFVDDSRVSGFYRMCGNLELCDVAERHFSREEAGEYRETTLVALAEFEALL